MHLLVNTLVSSIILCNKCGCSVNELFKHIDFDFSLRYTLGLHGSDDSPFGRVTYRKKRGESYKGQAVNYIDSKS